MHTRSRLLVAIAAAAPWSATLANDVPEAEANGQAANNSTTTAQAIDPAAFTPNMNPDVFGNLPTASILGNLGGDDVDFFSFMAGPGSVYFDIDGAAPATDTYLALFDAAGTLLADDNDSDPVDPGSLSTFDAFIGTYQLPAQGLYYIAVAGEDNFANATFTGDDFTELFRPDGGFGGFAFGAATPGDSSFDRSGPQTGGAYTLHITIPAPGPALAVLAGLGAAPRRRRGA